MTTLQGCTNDGSHKEVALEVELSIAACFDDPHDTLVHLSSLTKIKVPRTLNRVFTLFLEDSDGH